MKSGCKYLRRSNLLLLLACGTLAFATASHADAPKPLKATSIVISKAKPVTIVLAAETIQSEETASKELKHYLDEMTGVDCQIVREGSAAKLDGTLIYVGPTKFAAQNLTDKKAFGGEEWLLQNIGGKLVITGGRPRGTLYGAYHFLEDVCGVRWWSRWEEDVPQQKQIKVNALSRREQPAFSYRDIYREYHADWDSGITPARARLNRDGDSPMDSMYGGANTYGPPAHSHTVYMYIDKDKYFADHPDWYALVNGKRTAGYDVSQLDYTNDEMRAEFLRLLLDTIRKSRADAIAKQLPVPAIYAVDQGDANAWCECEKCAAIVAREGSESGPVIDFVNYMADAVAKEFPDVLLSTLAYQKSEKPPKTLRPRDNIVVKLTNTTSSYTHLLTEPVNQTMHDRVKSWAAISGHLGIWDYVTFHTLNNQNLGFPFPNEHTFGPNNQFYHQNHVDRMFVEMENTVNGDVRDLKLWLMAKTLENPNADNAKLIKDFSDGYYGPASPHFLRYRQQLKVAGERNNINLRFFGAISSFSYLKLPDVVKMQQTFDAGEKAVAGKPVFLKRLRQARLSLDRSALFFYPAYRLQNEAAGGTAATMPLDQKVMADRALETWTEQAKMRMPASKLAEELDIAQKEIGRYLEIPKEYPLPEQFKDYHKEDVIDLPAASNAFQNNEALHSLLIDDPEAPTGKTEIFNYDERPDKDAYAMPMAWGFYDLTTRKEIKLPPLQLADIKGPGYHWYKMGTMENLDTFLAYFTWSWHLRSPDNNDVIARSGKNGRYDVWVNMKFEGPMHGFNVPGQKNALYVERIILTPAKP
jgi:hypothetical protein